MSTYTVIDPISIDGVRAEVGSSVQLDDETALRLLEAGCIEESAARAEQSPATVAPESLRETPVPSAPEPAPSPEPVSPPRSRRNR